jgi:putative ABC transport system substrate-binding protein
MRRREFIAGLGSAAAWPSAARAQQPERVRRIGVLTPFAESDPAARGYVTLFRETLRKLGWVEGRNIRIDYRWGAGNGNRIRAYAEELVELASEVIFVGGSPGVAALKQMTRTTPIVFADVPDPIANGFVISLARPGGNITGFAQYEQSIVRKLLELLKQLAPRVARVAFIYDPANPNWSGYLAELETVAPSLGVRVSPAPVRDPVEIDLAIEAFAREPGGGVIAKASPTVNVHRQVLIARAAQHNLPAVYEFRYFVAEGGLASYGIDSTQLYRGAAGYVDRILKGDKPGDLPVQFATKFELVINTATAKALGLDLPTALLIGADELIE